MTHCTFQFFDISNVPSQYFTVRSDVYKSDLDMAITSHPDSFDGISALLGIMNDERIIGGARFTAAEKHRIPLQTNGFALDQYIDHSLLDMGVGEVSRVFILPEYRNVKTLEQLYVNMNAKRKLCNVSCLLTIAPMAQARLTLRICKRLGFAASLIRNIPIESDGPYSHLGEICLVKILEN